MGDFTKLAKKVVSVARGEDKKKPSPYDTKATVNRVDYENRKAYVRFYGGVDETPVDLTVNCERGDTVQVRVGGGRAWIVGNQTAPPTDDKAVNILKHTVNNLQGNLDKTREDLEKEIEEIEPGEGKLIERIATEYILSELNYLVDDEVVPYEPTPGEPMEWSEELPEWVPSPRTYFWKRTVIYYTDGTVDEQDPILDANAQISAEADFAISSENNHFWHDTTGAYVTEQNKNAALGYASRVTNAGILQTYNGNLLTAWTGSGVSFYDGSGATASASKMLASFNSTGITFDTTTPFTIGNTTGLNPSYIRWINDNGVWKLQINADTIQFGGTDIEDIVDPYEIKTNVDSIVSDPENYTTTPTSITSRLYKDGASTSAVIKVESSTNGTYWTEFYSSSGPVGSSTFNVNSYYNYKYIRISYYEEYRSSESPYFFGLLKQKMLPMIAVGETGPAGEGAQYNQYMKWDSTNGLQFYAEAYNTDATTYSAMKNDGLHIYQSNNEVAYFTSSGAVIKSSSTDKYIYLNSNALSFYNTNALCGSLKFGSYAASTSEGNYLNISTNYNNRYTADIKASTNTYTSSASIGLGAPGNYGVDLDIYCTPNNLDNNYGILSLYDNIGSTTSQELLTITANGNVKLCGHREHIGFTNEQSTTTELTLTKSWANTGAYLDLWKGVYVIEAQITISQTSSNTVIGMRIANTTDSVTYGKSTVAIGGNNTNLTTVAIVSIDDISSKSSTSRYYIQVRKTQSTTSTVKISEAGLKAVRIA